MERNEKRTFQALALAVGPMFETLRTDTLSLPSSSKNILAKSPRVAFLIKGMDLHCQSQSWSGAMQRQAAVSSVTGLLIVPPLPARKGQLHPFRYLSTNIHLHS